MFPADPITSAVWAVPAGLTKVADVLDGTDHRVVVSGGTVGTTYAITSTATTASGLVDVRTVEVRVRMT